MVQRFMTKFATRRKTLTSLLHNIIAQHKLLIFFEHGSRRALRCSLDDIVAKVAPRAHAILIFDQAGWHGAKSLRTPSNVSLVPPPPRAPELNPQETSASLCRANSLSRSLLLRLEHPHD